MNLLVVGDGPRDQRALPNLVCGIVGTALETRYDDWHQLRYLKGKGSVYARKLKYLTRRAQADGFVGMAVVVDTDKSTPRTKFRELRLGRTEDRQKNCPFPTAIGEANPHFDVWLLDDPVAVRDALGFATDFQVPNAIKVDYPKTELSKLVEQSSIGFSHTSEALGAIAQRVSLNRCAHGKKTGFENFVEDVHNEIQPAVNESAT